MVEDIIDICTQLHRDAFGNVERLMQSEIDSVGRRTIESIADSNSRLRIEVRPCSAG